MRGGCDSKVVKIERGGESIDFKRIEWCLGDEQSIERCGGSDVGFWEDAIDGQTVHGGNNRSERRRIMNA